MAFCCLPGRTIALVLHLEPLTLTEGRSLRAGLWSLPGNPTGFLEPPGPPIQLSWSIWGLPGSPNRGASRLPNWLAASLPGSPKWLFCCLLGCPHRSLESPKQSKWLSGASRAAQIAPVVHEFASRAVQMVSGASRALVATILPFYKSGGHAPFAKPKWPDPCAFLVTPPFFLRRGRNPSASRAVEMGSGASRALVATVSPFHKFSWPLIGRAATPHSQNLNGWIHAHSLSRLLSFFGSAATPCSVAGVAASPFLFFCICRLCLHMLLCLPSVSWHGPWASSDAIDGHARGEKERPRACPATEGNPKP